MTKRPELDQILIRPAYPDDDASLRALAQLDSAPVPAEPLLVAEVGGELRAALSLHDRALVADPFEPTEPLVVLLEVQATQLAQPRWGARRRRTSVLRTAAAVWRGLAARESAAAFRPGAGSGAAARELVLSGGPGGFSRAP